MTKKIWNVLGLGGIVTISTTLILLSFSGCQTSQKEKVEKQILSKEREVVLAAELRKTIDKQFGIIRNDEAKKFLDGVLGRILSANPTLGTPDKFKIHFLNSTNKIFISGLNGDLFISTHAIRGVTYENELAYLLAFAVMTSVRDLAVKKVIAEEGEEIGNSLLTLPTTPPAKHNLFSGELFKKGGFFDYGVETYVSIAKLAVGVLHNTNYDVRGALTAMSVPKIFLTEFFVGPETVQPDVKVEIARLSPTRDVILKTKEFDRFAAKFKRTFVRAKEETVRKMEKQSLVKRERPEGKKSTDADQKNLTQITGWLSRMGKSINVRALPGDASTRRYFRVRTRNSSFILMKMDTFSELGDQLPFLQVQRHLSKLGVNVPQVIDLEPKKGMILLTDLGDETLLKRLERVSKKRDQLVWFKRAIDLVLNMQVVATQHTAPIDAYNLYFDEEKLMWEVGFTLAHFYSGLLAPQIPLKESKRVENYFATICKRLASQDWYFTHRDYHGRNIMVKGNELFMIDFQDARLGCAQYDLASLLRDSYYQLEEEVVYELVDYYIRCKARLEGTKVNQKEFVKVFDLMSIQRNFKAIGSFASFYVKRQDARYLKFIGNTFENIRRNLLKYPEYDELRYLLYRYYYF